MDINDAIFYINEPCGNISDDASFYLVTATTLISGAAGLAGKYGMAFMTTIAGWIFPTAITSAFCSQLPQIIMFTSIKNRCPWCENFLFFPKRKNGNFYCSNCKNKITFKRVNIVGLSICFAGTFFANILTIALIIIVIQIGRAHV